MYSKWLCPYAAENNYIESLQSTTLILSYGVSTMKVTDFGVDLRIRNFFSGIKGRLNITGVEIPT
jgi:hypothetical protein